MSRELPKKTLRRQEKLFLPENVEQILDCSSDGIWITDGEGTVLYMNRTNEHMLGVTREEMIGRNCADLVKEKVFQYSATMKAIEEKKQVSLNGYNYRTKLHVLITSTPLLAEEGHIRYVINNVRDMTELNRIVDELKQKDEVIREQTKEIQNLLTLRTNRRVNTDMVVASPEMIRILDMAQRVGQFESTVLLMGESGVGKEVVANEIVSSSLRAEKSFVKVNCGAIPENLIESELFGYEPGAFTGASKNGKMGLFELANHGTILLDEIGELSMHLQVKLLRVLQDRCIQRVGGTKKKELDIRVIAATNADLRKKVEEGTFRGDLYYRLNVVTIEIPPLRQRTEDIPQLIRFYADKYSKKYNIEKEFTEDCIQHMMKYSWPGNIRELQNVVENLIIMTDGSRIETDSLPERFRDSSGELRLVTYLQSDRSMPLKDAVREIENQIILRTMEKCGSTREAAKLLGVNQSTIVRKLQQAREES